MLPIVTRRDVTVGRMSDVVRLVGCRRRVDGQPPVLQRDVTDHFSQRVARHEVLGRQGAHAVTYAPPQLPPGFGRMVALLVTMAAVQVGGRHVGNGAGDGHHGGHHRSPEKKKLVFKIFDV